MALTLECFKFQYIVDESKYPFIYIRVYEFLYMHVVGDVIVLVFFILFSFFKVMKLTSPNLNYCTIIGALLLYMATISAVIQSNSLAEWDYICLV